MSEPLSDPEMVVRLSQAFRDMIQMDELDALLLGYAALEEMREPTEAMRYAAYDAVAASAAEIQRVVWQSDSDRTWQAMIDAALQCSRVAIRD